MPFLVRPSHRGHTLQGCCVGSQNDNSDERAGPVPDQPKEVDDRVIEPGCAYDRYWYYSEKRM